ncbi:BTB/POZ domain [Trinorchestia longiramus]|nr:BTB/POZ domain [Trinorchestia longiramus]
MGVNASCQPESVVGPHTFFTTLTMPQSSSMGSHNSNAPIAAAVSSGHSSSSSSHNPHQHRSDKKRRLASLATLRKKLVLCRRRSSKSCDHARVIRDLLQDWTLREIAALSEEYEASAALKDLSVQPKDNHRMFVQLTGNHRMLVEPKDNHRMFVQLTDNHRRLVETTDNHMWLVDPHPQGVLGGQFDLAKDEVRERLQTNLNRREADLARPPAPTYKQDLSDLFDYKYCTDVDLVFQGAVFPVHRAILSSRCPYFQDVLRKIPGYGAQIGVDIRTPGIDIPMFSALLRYLYTGEFNPYDGTSKAHQMRLSNMDLLFQLCEEFGTPNPLECDLRYLLDSGDYADCVLVFSSSGDGTGGSGSGATVGGQTCGEGANTVIGGGGSVSGGSVGGDSGSLSGGHSSDYGFHNRLEVYCHKSILSARSPFFRSLIQRRQRYSEEAGLCNVNAVTPPTRIVLDEGVIPKRYARVLLQAVYLDTLDLNCIIRDSGSSNSLSEAQSMTVTGRAHLTTVEEAMEVYQIGRFLELDILTQSCEDLIVESLSLDNLVSVLHWSRQSHGSAWVQRQALHYLREEFSQVAQSPVLLELDKQTLIHALMSDFLQAAELEVLQSVLRWGEHQLVKRMEEREPNLVSQTAHSVTRKGLRKRDLNDVELREILSELLPHVRMDHVLPPTHEVFNQAIKRGLVSTPPSHMIGADTTNYRINAWIRGKNNGLFVKPRLFTPYAEEVKTILDEQAGTGVSVRLPCYVSHIPDTLYMVDQHRPSSTTVANTVDLVPSTVPIPEPEVVAGMVRRERELTASPGYQRAAGLLFADRRMMRRRVRLRVVREFNMPDTVAEVLENATYTDETQQTPHCHVRDEGRSRLHPPEFMIETMTGDPRTDNMPESEPPLSDVVPDVALASSSLSALHLSSMGGGGVGHGMPMDGGGSWHRRGSSHRSSRSSSGRQSSPGSKQRTSASLEALERTSMGSCKTLDRSTDHSTMALDLVDGSAQYGCLRGSSKSSKQHRASSRPQLSVPPSVQSLSPPLTSVPVLPPPPPASLQYTSSLTPPPTQLHHPHPHSYTLKHPPRASSLHHYSTLNPRHHSVGGHHTLHHSNRSAYTPPPVLHPTTQSSLSTANVPAGTPPMFL